jgi:hypothetical protein
MRPTVGQILSGLALGAVAASMLVMPERFIGAEDAAVTGLVLQATDERIVVQAVPIPPRRAHRAAPVKRRVIVIERRAPVAITISRRIPARAGVTPPPPPTARMVVAQHPTPPPPSPKPAPPPPVEPPTVDVASESYKKDKAKGEKRKEKKQKKWRHEEDEDDQDRGDRHEDRHDGDKHGDKDD